MSEDHIDLKSPEQLESLLNLIKDSAEIMIKWEEDKYNGSESDYDDDDDGDEVVMRSQILITDGLQNSC